MWCRKRLTVRKTEAVLISARPFTGPMRPLRFYCSFINFTTKSTCLGIVTDNKLSWIPQINALHKKFDGKRKILKRVKGLPTSILEEIYCKGIIPTITYCIAVWETCPIPTFSNVEKMHTKAAKLIYKLHSETRDLNVPRTTN